MFFHVIASCYWLLSE